jgi:hypothetical protein
MEPGMVLRRIEFILSASPVISWLRANGSKNSINNYFFTDVQDKGMTPSPFVSGLFVRGTHIIGNCISSHFL